MLISRRSPPVSGWVRPRGRVPTCSVRIPRSPSLLPFFVRGCVGPLEVHPRPGTGGRGLGTGPGLGRRGESPTYRNPFYESERYGVRSRNFIPTFVMEGVSWIFSFTFRPSSHRPWIIHEFDILEDNNNDIKNQVLSVCPSDVFLRLSVTRELWGRGFPPTDPFSL